MGYQDRDYFREAHTPYLDLIRSTRVCWGIIATFAVVYLACAFTTESSQPLADYLRLDPSLMVNDWQWQRLLTASFVCDSPWHFVFALLIIWLIGHEMEQMVGSMELLAFFVVANVLSNLSLMLIYHFAGPWSPLAMQSFGPMGAVMALLTWAVAISPYRVVSYLFVPMPLWIVGILTLVIDLFFFLQLLPLGIKLSLHALSIPFAFVYHTLNWRLTGWPRWTGRRRWAARRQLTPVLQMPQRTQAARDIERPMEIVASVRAVDEQLEAKVDAILEKVSQSGMQSLSEDEKTTLKRASEVMKRKKS